MLEAMAAGTPIVASDWLGPGEIINESCGIKVPVSSEKAFVDGLAEAMIRIASDSELRNRLSQGAIERAQEFAWEPKARKVLDVLTEFIGKQERPKNIAAHAVPA